MVKKLTSGFTLIEIILVLAIAGMILAMILMAVPQTEQTRRDTSRKADLARLQQQIEFYGSNNSGTYPAHLSDAPLCGGPGSYIPNPFNDPSSQMNYCSIPSGTPGYLTYDRGDSGGTGCNGVALSNARQFVVHMKLEHGTACLDNL